MMVGRVGILIGTGCACCLGAVVAGLIISDKSAQGNLINEVRLETGSAITLQAFFEEIPEDAALVTDVSGIDTSVPGTYPLVISYGGKEEDVTLTISDTTAPSATAVSQSIYLGKELPSAEDFVTDVYDLSGNVTIDFKEIPDKFTAGCADVTIVLFDSYGNSSEVVSQLDVIDDCTGPTIYAPNSISLMVGEEIDLEAWVTATDDYDTDPEIFIDTSCVNFSKIGAYTLAYVALDDAGNPTRKEIPVTILPPEGDDFNEYVYQMADDILVTLKAKKKTKTALAIFNYVHDMMTYDSSKQGASTPEEAAFIGFTTHTGNCYIYASCCKILLDRAGISNMYITRYPITTSGHYWLLVRLNGKWWHCDATPFMGHEGIYFMLTDDQLDQYHEFNPDKYPPRSTTHSGMAVGACVGMAKDYSAAPVDVASDDPMIDDEALIPSVTPTPSVTPALTPAVTPSVTPGAEAGGGENAEGGDTEDPGLPPVPTVAPEETEPAPTETSADTTEGGETGV